MILTPPNRKLWTMLLAIFAACTIGCVVAWGVLLTGFCSNPRKPVVETGQVIARNCHGMTVYISEREDALLHWLVPIGVLFIVLTTIAMMKVFLSYAKVKVKITVRVDDSSPRR